MGKLLIRKLSALFLALFLVGMLGVLTGCEGDDGAPGPQGLQGDTGDTGPQGPPGPGVDIEQQILAGSITAEDITPLNLILDLSQTVSYDAATGAVSIHFFLTDENGKAVNVFNDAYELRVYASELIPTIADDTDNPGPSWTQLFNERGTPAAGVPMDGTLTLVDEETGEYNYVCDNTLAATENVVRITVRARWRLDSPRDINNERVVFANPVNASYDFLQSDPGTRLVSSGADMVTTAACESCHGARIGDVGHGGGYTQVKTCNNCHNVNFMTAARQQADLAFMIHRIHSAGVLTLDGEDISFEEVTYPQEIFNCSKCHNGPEADLAFSNPTRANCGSCHSDVNFATGVGHFTGLIQTSDAACNLCHDPAAIQAVHDPAPALANVPEFEVTITMTEPANGTHYVTGEAPIVTVTLADYVTGDPVPGTVYTAPQDGETVADLTEGLSTADLYVYGPRRFAIPVLATDTIDDPGFVAPPTQGHALFTGGTDPQVMTDATGFKYQLLAIPANIEAGTYMVRFEGADYGADETDYVTSSSTHITFQVGQATEEPKVSGDACINCHGDTRMHLEGAFPHNVPFDTDPCLGCHDRSGNYGDYIGNRVHAIHKASVTGDTHASPPEDPSLPGSRNWSEVTFPQPPNNCAICHTNAKAPTPVWRLPSMLACGGCHGVNPDVLPADYPTVDPAIILREKAAATHMVQNGGDAVAEDDGAMPTTACMVCHGEGRVADPFFTHKIRRFRAQPVDPNE